METLILRGGRKLTPEATCEFKRAYCVYRSALNTLADLAVQKKEAKHGKTWENMRKRGKKRNFEKKKVLNKKT